MSVRDRELDPDLVHPLVDAKIYQLMKRA